MRFLLFLVLLSCSTVNTKKYDMVVYAGRFQPFHHGHYSVVKEAEKYGKHVLIAISQAKNGKIDSRNPFTGNQRYNAINDTLNHDELKIFQDTINSSKHDSIVLISQNDQEIFNASSKNTDTNTQFYIGSVGKHMTAYILLMSLKEKYPKAKLEDLLNKKLNTLFPNSKILTSINSPWAKDITLLDLLTNKSGLSDYIDKYFDGEKINLNKPIKYGELLSDVKFNPSKNYQYSNTNYFIVARLIEELNNESFEKSFNKFIKQPAKLNSTFCITKGNYFSIKQSECCKKLSPNLNNEVFIDMSNTSGSGSVISTGNDLMKWIKYLFKNAKQDIIHIMLKNYGLDSDGDIINLGFFTQKTNRLGNLIGHQGDIDSYHSFLGYSKEKDTVIIILSNNKNDSNKLTENLIEYVDNDSHISVIQLESIDGDWIKEKDKLLNKWNENLLKCAYDKYRKIFNKNPSKENIAFIYYDRDGVDYGKRFEKHFDILKIDKPFEDDISATKIRKIFFEQGKIDKNLPFGTKKLLKSLKQ